jgi:hypothetical protein
MYDPQPNRGRALGGCRPTLQGQLRTSCSMWRGRTGRKPNGSRQGGWREYFAAYLRFLGRSKGLQEAPSSIFVARYLTERTSCDAIRGGVRVLGSSRDDRNRVMPQCARSSKTLWKDQKQAKEDTMVLYELVIRWNGLRVKVFPI